MAVHKINENKIGGHGCRQQISGGIEQEHTNSL